MCWPLAVDIESITVNISHDECPCLYLGLVQPVLAADLGPS